MLNLLILFVVTIFNGWNVQEEPFREYKITEKKYNDSLNCIEIDQYRIRIIYPKDSSRSRILNVRSNNGILLIGLASFGNFGLSVEFATQFTTQKHYDYMYKYANEGGSLGDSELPEKAEDFVNHRDLFYSGVIYGYFYSHVAFDNRIFGVHDDNYGIIDYFTYVDSVQVKIMIGGDFDSLYSKINRLLESTFQIDVYSTYYDNISSKLAYAIFKEKFYPIIENIRIQKY